MRGGGKVWASSDGSGWASTPGDAAFTWPPAPPPRPSTASRGFSSRTVSKSPFRTANPRIVNITTVNLFARRRGRRLITSVRPSGLGLSKDTNLPNSSSQNWFYDLDGRYARCITSRCRHVDGIPRLLLLPAADPPPAAPTSFIYKSSLSPDFQMFLPGCRHTSEQRLQRCRPSFIHNVCLTLQWKKKFLDQPFFSSKRPHHPSQAIRSSIDNAQKCPHSTCVIIFRFCLCHIT